MEGSKEQKSNRNRLYTVMVGVLALAVWVLVDAQELVAAAIIYIGIALVNIFLYGQWAKIGGGDIIGIDKNWIKDAFIGLILGIATIIAGQFISIIGTLGIPPVQSIAGTIGRFIIIVPVAATFESVFFQGFILDYLKDKIKMPWFFANLTMAILFSLFHLTAYGGSLNGNSGAFISVAIMGFIFGLVATKQNSLSGIIVYHAIMNSWLGFVKYAVIIA